MSWNRVVAADGATGDLLQILGCGHADRGSPFEFALRERAARLATSGTRTTRVSGASSVMSPMPALAIVSIHLEGTRLSRSAAGREERTLHLDINAALC